MLPSLKEIKELLTTIIRSSFIGIITGVIPGTGGDTACWFAYNEAKDFLKTRISLELVFQKVLLQLKPPIMP